MGRALAFIIAFVCVAFLLVLGWYYFQEGSFEGAGERMDATSEDLPEEAAEVADDVSDAAEDVSNELEEEADEPN